MQREEVILQSISEILIIMARYWTRIVLLATIFSVAEADYKESKDCRFRIFHEVSSPFNEEFLIYITIRSSFTLGIKFDNEIHLETRDAFTFKNHITTHFKVRGGETKNDVENLPILIPEGWNLIRVAVDNKTLTVILVHPEGNVSLYTQHLDYNVEAMQVENICTRCSEAAPVFDVPEGEEVPVLLWPEGSKQSIELSAGNSTDLYFKFPGETKNYSVPSNSTLIVSTSFQGNQIMLKVFKEGDRKEIGNSTVPMNTTMSLMFGGGPAQVRLTKVPGSYNSSLAAPVTTPPASPCCVLAVVFGILVIVGVSAYVVLRKRELKSRPGKSSSNDIEANDENGNEQMRLMNQNNIGITKKFTVLVSRDDVSRFVDTLRKHCGDAATIYVHTTAMNDGQEEYQKLLCISDNLHNIRNAVMNEIDQLHNKGPALINFTGTMEQKKWQALLQSLNYYNLQFRELAITS